MASVTKVLRAGQKCDEIGAVLATKENESVISSKESSLIWDPESGHNRGSPQIFEFVEEATGLMIWLTSVLKALI